MCQAVGQMTAQQIGSFGMASPQHGTSTRFASALAANTKISWLAWPCLAAGAGMAVQGRYPAPLAGWMLWSRSAVASWCRVWDGWPASQVEPNDAAVLDFEGQAPQLPCPLFAVCFPVQPGGCWPLTL